MDFRDTGLPLNEQVFKAFQAWRNNAAIFAKEQGTTEDYPVRLAQIISKTSPEDTAAMTLALLISVPAVAASVMKNRFGAKTSETLAEFWTHSRTGYTYAAQASEAVKTVSLAIAIEAFESFTKRIDAVAEAAPVAPKGETLVRILQQLSLPGADLFERMGDKMSLPTHPALEQLYAEKREDYRAAREMKAQLLTSLGAPASLQPQNPFYPDFEDQVLLDDPKVRNAYALLLEDSRLKPAGFEAAMAAGKLLSKQTDTKYPEAVAASLLVLGLPKFGRADLGFLEHKLDADVLNLLKNFDDHTGAGAVKRMVRAPVAVRQLALAQGIVALGQARVQSEAIMEKAAQLPQGKGDLVKAFQLEPLITMAEAIPAALNPILGTTDATRLEHIFSAEVDQLNRFMRQNMPPRPIPMSHRLMAPKA